MLTAHTAARTDEQSVRDSTGGLITVITGKTRNALAPKD